MNSPTTVRSRYHWIALGLAVIVIVLAFLMEARPNGRVHFRFAPGHVLPHMCASKIVFDAECAGCGLTRSFIHLAAFRPSESWRVHRAGWLLALLVVGQVPYRIVQLRRIAAGQVVRAPAWAWWVVCLIVAAVFGHWALALAGI